MLLSDTDNRAAQQFVSKLLRNLRQIPVTSDWGVTCSIGGVTFLNPEITPERALASADELMYKVKRKGKGTVEFSVYGDAVQPVA